MVAVSSAALHVEASSDGVSKAKRTIMSQIHLSGFAVVLAVTSSAWAGVEPYPAAVQVEAASTKTRSDVIAELQEAQRLGLMASVEFDVPSYNVSLDSGDSGRASRARVHAETLEASRLGLLSAGESDAPVATSEQDRLVETAGQLAFNQARAAQLAAVTKTVNQ
jgi:hypothetical protein